MSALRIQRYEPQPAAFRAYDPPWAEVAALLIQTIENREPRLHVDHIGSTSVPECRGKGVIDLAVTYLEGDLENAKAALDTLGFQRQHGRDPFPETRPMREGSVTVFGETFNVHAHVILRDGEEHRELLGFRNALRSDPELRRAYESEKERIIAGGTTDSLEYCYAKGAFIAQTLETIGKP
ncbi:MAG TPA: GrpB family protein [Bryobacteraceae bacterium]|nr:GrpB family protein [Bryobacteraceae bacterium]